MSQRTFMAGVALLKAEGNIYRLGLDGPALDAFRLGQALRWFLIAVALLPPPRRTILALPVDIYRRMVEALGSDAGNMTPAEIVAEAMRRFPGGPGTMPA